MTATAERHKVLVIDDSFMVRKSLVDQLSSQRFEVFEASDGPSGLNEASRINPDVILLDYVMPGMNGFEVYQALRQQPQFANTPVIVISSSREEVIKKFGQPFIGFDFLPKAFTREQLEERIDAVLPMRQTGIKPQPVNFQEIHTALVMGMEELQGRLVQELNGLRSSGPDRTGEILDRLNVLESILKPTDRTNDILDRLNALESQLKPVDRSSEILDRLGALEHRLSSPQAGTQEVLERLGSLERTLKPADRTGEVLERFYNLEQALKGISSDDRSGEILDRLRNLEGALGRIPTSDRASEILDRLRTLEGRFSSPAPDRIPEVLDRLSGLTRTVEGQSTSQPDLEPLVTRLDKLEARLSQAAPTAVAGPNLVSWVTVGLVLVSILATLIHH